MNRDLSVGVSIKPAGLDVNAQQGRCTQGDLQQARGRDVFSCRCFQRLSFGHTVLLPWVTGMEAPCGVDISEDHLMSLRWSTSCTQCGQLSGASFY